MALPNFITAAMKLSVPVNGVLIPFKNCVDSLYRFCRPLLFHNEDPTFDLSYSGSSLLLRTGGRNVMLCTRHQITNTQREPSDVVMVVIDPDGAKVALTPNEVSRVTVEAPEHANLDDIFIAEYASERDGRNIESQFLKLDIDAIPDLRSVPSDQIVAIFAIGYPTRFSSFEMTLDEDESPVGLEIINRWVKVYLEKAAPSPWDTELRVPLQLHSEYPAKIEDPDGFSGAPVFFVFQDEKMNAHLGFAGMISHANKSGRFMIYETAFIRKLLETSPG